MNKARTHPAPVRLFKWLAFVALAVVFGLTFFPALLGTEARERVTWTACFLVAVSAFVDFTWGDGADAAYGISERFRPSWWPVVMEREEFRRFARHLMAGMLVFFTCVYLTLLLSQPWIAALGVVGIDVAMVSLVVRFRFWNRAAGIKRAVMRLYSAVFLAALAYISGVLIAALIWKVDLPTLLSRSR